MITFLAAVGTIYLVGTLVMISVCVWWTVRNVRAVQRDDETA